MSTAFTKGPWRWELNKRSKRVQLCGGERTYDLTVMDFVRYGFDGAAPRFIVDGLLFRCDDFGAIVPKREHHADWFQSIEHPDATLIQTAPELYEALEELLKDYEESDFDIVGKDRLLIAKCKAVLAKASGKKEEGK